MSLSTRDRGAVELDRPSALGRLVSRPAAFAESVWGLEPLVTRSAELPLGLDDLFSLAAADELLSRRGLRTPFVRAAKDGRTFDDGEFTAAGGVGARIGDQVCDDKVLDLFANGTSVVLQALHRVWPPLVDFTADLSEELGHPVQANGYVTPPHGTGFSDHYDVHDVFVLQIAGHKHWRLRRPVRRWPLRDDAWTKHSAQVRSSVAATPPQELTLHPGDCLYLPRGFLHSATATEVVSAHVTLGVHTWDGMHVARAIIDTVTDALAMDEAARAPLALGVDVTEPVDLRGTVADLRARLSSLLGEVSEQQVAQRLEEAALRSRRPAPLGPIAQAERVRALIESDVIHVRAHVVPRLVRTDGRVHLTSRAGRLELARDDESALETLLSQGSAPASLVGVDLARRLLVAGIVT